MPRGWPSLSFLAGEKKKGVGLILRASPKPCRSIASSTSPSYRQAPSPSYIVHDAEPDIDVPTGSELKLWLLQIKEIHRLRWRLSNGPLDSDLPLRPKQINLGIVGSKESVEGTTRSRRPRNTSARVPSQSRMIENIGGVLAYQQALRLVSC
jgi:hypothetical protein